MSLVKAIKFRRLAAQLNMAETCQFVQKLMNNHANIITMLLFNLMINPSSHAINSDEINDMVSNIILARKKKPKAITTQHMKLDQVPKQLIGVCASFLDQKDYINFSKLNRNMFIGCNDTNQLQELDIHKVSMINLALFPSVKCLALNMNKLNELHGLSTLSQLKIVKLDAKGKTDCDIGPLQDIDTSNVTQLSLANFGNRNAGIRRLFDSDKFIKLFQRFPSIEYLDCKYVLCNIDGNEIKKVCPNVKGFGRFPMGNNASLFRSFANGLEYFRLPPCSGGGDTFKLHNFNFSKLEQLTLGRPNIKSINDILKTAKNLKQMRIITTVRDKCLMTPQETENIFTNVIKQCKSLEYITFIDDGKLIDAALKGIENGLFETRVWNRKQMKIKIKIAKQNMSNVAVLTAVKIVKWLESSNIKDFLFIVVQNGNLNDSLHKVLTNNVSSNNQMKIYKHGFNVANKDCRINGYRQKWKVKY